jgi:hypothetical protein
MLTNLSNAFRAAGVSIPKVSPGWVVAKYDLREDVSSNEGTLHTVSGNHKEGAKHIQIRPFIERTANDEWDVHKLVFLCYPIRTVKEERIIRMLEKSLSDSILGG